MIEAASDMGVFLCCGAPLGSGRATLNDDFARRGRLD
jgi:hypothetical protein